MKLTTDSVQIAPASWCAAEGSERGCGGVGGGGGGGGSGHPVQQELALSLSSLGSRLARSNLQVSGLPEKIFFYYFVQIIGRFEYTAIIFNFNVIY